MSCKQAFALTAEYFLAERYAVRTVTVPVRSVVFHEPFPAFKFFLHRIPCFLIYDSLMAVLNIDLCYFPVIFYLTLGKEISRISLLQKRIAHMLFLFQDTHDCAWIPFCLPQTSRNFLFRQFLCNLCRIDSDKEVPVYPSHCLCLFLIDDKLPVLILIVSEELECVEMHLTVLKFRADAPFTVF